LLPFQPQQLLRVLRQLLAHLQSLGLVQVPQLLLGQEKKGLMLLCF
jgi:hypothetical protein